jgi:outer membrane immunogenic protein
MIRSTLLAAVSTVVLGSVAMAADLPSTKEPAPPYVAPIPTFSWSGCYAGVNVGGAWANQGANTYDPTLNASTAQAPDYVNLHGGNVIGGGQVGCNMQFNAFVAGIEGDFSGTHLFGSAIGPNNFPDGTPAGGGSIAFSRTLDWVSSIRGRLGYVVAPTVLIYATGGGAFGRASYFGMDTFNSPCPNCGTTSFGATRAGWVAGGGVEWAVWGNWILRAEYLHYSLDGPSSVANFQGTTNPAARFNFDRLNVNEGRVGVSYKFDFLAPATPVVAKY